MQALTLFLILQMISWSGWCGDEFDPYAKDMNDPTASGQHRVGTIEDFAYPGGKPDMAPAPKQEDPCKDLRKKKQDMDKKREDFAETVEEACLSDAQKCAKLRESQKKLNDEYPKLLESLKENNCE